MWSTLTVLRQSAYAILALCLLVFASGIANAATAHVDSIECTHHDATPTDFDSVIMIFDLDFTAPGQLGAWGITEEHTGASVAGSQNCGELNDQNGGGNKDHAAGTWWYRGFARVYHWLGITQVNDALHADFTDTHSP